MNVLVLHDLLGKEIFINPNHVVMVHPPHGLNPPNAKGVVRLSDGDHYAVQETAGEICFRILEL